MFQDIFQFYSITNIEKVDMKSVLHIGNERKSAVAIKTE